MGVCAKGTAMGRMVISPSGPGGDGGGLFRQRAGVVRPWAYEPVGGVLFDGMTDPSYRSAEGEERQGRPRRQSQRFTERDHREIEGRRLAEDRLRFPCNRRSQHFGMTVLVAQPGRFLGPDTPSGSQLHQKSSARIALWVEAVPEPGDLLAPPQTRAECVPGQVGLADFSEQRFNTVTHAAMLWPL